MSPRPIPSAASVVALTFALASHAADYTLPLKADSGFYDRRDALAGCTIAFGRDVDPATFVLRRQETAANVPHFFVPSGANAGVLHWRVAGEWEAMTLIVFELNYSEGKWSPEARGSADIESIVKELGNRVPNWSFEEEDPKARKVEGPRDGRSAPSWALQDYAGAHAKLGPKAQCRISEEEAFDGRKSLKLVGDARPEVNVHPYAYSVEFPLKPRTKYTLVYRVKIVEDRDAGLDTRLIDVQVNFLDKDKQSVAPGNYATNRLQSVFRLAGRPREGYLGKWMDVRQSKETTYNTAYGRIWLHTTGFTGTAYLDAIEFSEQTAGEPVKVEVGKERKVER